MGNPNRKIIAVYAPQNEYGNVLNLAINLVDEGSEVVIYNLKENLDLELPKLNNVTYSNSFISLSIVMAQTIIQKSDYVFFTQLESEISREYSVGLSSALGLGKPVTFIYSKGLLKEKYGKNDKFLLLQQRRTHLDTDLFNGILSLIEETSLHFEKGIGVSDYTGVLCLNRETKFNDKCEDEKNSFLMSLAYDDITDTGVRYTVDARGFNPMSEPHHVIHNLNGKRLYTLYKKFINVKQDRALPKGMKVYTEDSTIPCHEIQSAIQEHVNYIKFFGQTQIPMVGTKATTNVDPLS